MKKSKTLEEAGKYCLDISKLIFAGIVLTGIINSGGDKLWILCSGIFATIVTAFAGIACILLSDKSQEE